MFETQPWYVVAIFAGIFGILIGWGTSSGDDEVEARLGAIERALEEQVAAAASAADERASSLLAADDVLKAEIEGGIGALAAGQEVLTEQHGVLGEGQAALDVKVTDLAARLDAIEDLAEALTENMLSAEALQEALTQAYAARHAAHHGKGHGEGHGDGHEDGGKAEPVEAAEGEVELATADADADPRHVALTEAIGADGLVLGVGQTAIIGEGRLFISQITDEGVRGKVPGDAWVDLNVYGGSVEIGGCTLVLAGVLDGAAYLKPAC